MGELEMSLGPPQTLQDPRHTVDSALASQTVDPVQ